MIEIPYPKVILTPCNRYDKKVLRQLNHRILSAEIEIIYSDHIDRYFDSHRPKFPLSPKEFYVIPFVGMPDILKKYKLRIPNYSSLWLPSVALNAIAILEQLPEEEREIAVIGYDQNFSQFMGNYVLAVDLSMGFATFVFWEDDLKSFSRNPDFYLLAEVIND